MSENNICHLCHESDQVEWFQSSLCQCRGQRANKHFTCTVEWICSNGDDNCPFCNKPFKDQRIERFYSYNPSLSHYFIHLSGVYFIWILLTMNILFSILYSFMNCRRVPQDYCRSASNPLIFQILVLVCNLTIISIAIYTFLKTSKYVVRWIRFKRYIDCQTFISTLDLFIRNMSSQRNENQEYLQLMNGQEVQSNEQVVNQRMTTNVCRVCRLNESNYQPLITPCHCSGVNRYFHYNCLITHIISTSDQRCPECDYHFEDNRIQRLPSFNQFLYGSFIGSSILFYSIVQCLHCLFELLFPSIEMSSEVPIELREDPRRTHSTLKSNSNNLIVFWLILQIFGLYYSAIFIYLLWFKYQKNRIIEFRVNNNGNEEIHRFYINRKITEFGSE